MAGSASWLSFALYGLLTTHVVCLTVAPYCASYFWLKRIGFCAGLAVIALDFSAVSWTGGKSMVSLLLLAMLCGNLALLLSMWSANYNIRDGITNVLRSYSWECLGRTTVFNLTMIMLGACYEEIIWRQEIQSRLGTSLWAVVFATGLFYAAHISRSRKVRIPRLIDICSLSLITGLVFLKTRSLLAVVLIHSIRNQHSFALRYEADRSYRSTFDRFRDLLWARVTPWLSAKDDVAWTSKLLRNRNHN